MRWWKGTVLVGVLVAMGPWVGRARVTTRRNADERVGQRARDRSGRCHHAGRSGRPHGGLAGRRPARRHRQAGGARRGRVLRTWSRARPPPSTSPPVRSCGRPWSPRRVRHPRRRAARHRGPGVPARRRRPPPCRRPADGREGVDGDARSHPDVRIFSTPMLAPMTTVTAASSSSAWPRRVAPGPDDFTFRGPSSVSTRSPATSGGEPDIVRRRRGGHLGVVERHHRRGAGARLHRHRPGVRDAGRPAVRLDPGPRLRHRRPRVAPPVHRGRRVDLLPDRPGAGRRRGRHPDVVHDRRPDVVGVGDKGGLFACSTASRARRCGPGAHRGQPARRGDDDGRPRRVGPGPGGRRGRRRLRDVQPIRDSTGPQQRRPTVDTFALDATTGEVLWEQDARRRHVRVDDLGRRRRVPAVGAGPAPGARRRDRRDPVDGRAGGDMGAGVQVTDGYVLVPHGFWFGADDRPPGQADEDLPGGVVAYTLP